MPVPITVLMATHPFEGYLDPVMAMAEEFNRRHPELRVGIVGLDFEETAREVVRLAAEGRPPHLAEYYYSANQLARDTLGPDGRPLFTSVEKAIGGRTDILGEPVIIGDLEPAVRDFYSDGGELLSMPVTATTALLYANATLLDRAGLALPRTWAELAEACTAVRALPDGPAAGISWPNHGWLFQQAVAQQGGLLADADNGRSGRATTVRLTSPELAAFTGWWRQLAADGHYLYTGEPEDWPGSLGAFLSGQVAFTLCSSKMTGDIVAWAAEAGFAVTAGRMPYHERVPYAGNMVSGQSLWLADGLDKSTSDGALAFLQFLANPRNAAGWHLAQGFLPVTRGAVDLLAAEGWFAEHPQQLAATEQLRAADGSPAALGAVLGDLAGIQGVLTAAMHDVLVARADPGARFAAAQAEAQRLLDAYTVHVVGGERPRTPAVLTVG